MSFVGNASSRLEFYMISDTILHYEILEKLGEAHLHLRFSTDAAEEAKSIGGRGEPPRRLVLRSLSEGGSHSTYRGNDK